MKPIVINLTMAQIKKLLPYQSEIYRMGAAKKPGILVAQVFDDHMRVGIITNEQSVKVAKDATKMIYQAPERY